jgi:hypothetical protein
MLPNIERFQVNWEDGMKVSSKDFNQMANANSDWLRDIRCIFINEYKYGILPGGRVDIDLMPGSKKGFWEIRLKNCRALTKGGNRIEITDVTIDHNGIEIQPPTPTIEINLAEKFLEGIKIKSLVIKVDPFNSQAFGPIENGTKMPFKIPRYELFITDQNIEQHLEPDELKIAELNCPDGKGLEWSKEYYPFAISMYSYDQIKNHFEKAESYLKLIFKNTIIVHQNAYDSKNDEKYALEAIGFTKGMAQFLSSYKFDFSYRGRYESPLFFICKMGDFFNFFNAQFQLFRSFSQTNWKHMTYNGDFIGINEDIENILADLEKDIHPLFQNLNKIEKVLEKINELFIRLSGESFQKVVIDTGPATR